MSRLSEMDLSSATNLINLGAMHSMPRLVALCEKFLISSVDFEDPESVIALLWYACVAVVLVHGALLSTADVSCVASRSKWATWRVT